MIPLHKLDYSVKIRTREPPDMVEDSSTHVLIDNHSHSFEVETALDHGSTNNLEKRRNQRAKTLLD